MANTLTNLIPDIYAARDIVSRELVGFIPSVMMDASAQRAAVNQNIRVPISPAAAAEDITAAVIPPDTGDQSIGNVLVQITKARAVPFRWTGEEQKGVNAGPGYRTLQRDQIVQAMRTLTNEVETDLGALYSSASRATGTAGTAPFGSDLSDPANALKILKDNGAPNADLNLVIDTSAGANMRKQAQLTKVNDAGTEATLRRGELLNIHGFAIRESAQVPTHTKGTGTGYLVNNASGYAVGATTIAADTGGGTLLAGDVVTFAGDTNKYIAATALSAGSFTIAAPGLRVALADNAAITIGGTFAANLAFHRSSILLLARAPELPEEGDAALDILTVTDPLSGLTFEFAMYGEYRRIRYQVGLAWGVKAIKPAHMAVLLG